MSVPSGPNLPATNLNANIVEGPDTGKRTAITSNEDSREEAQSKRKGSNKKEGGKGKKDEKKEMNPSVSTIIMNDKPDPPNSTSTVPIAESNNTICFYIMCELKWMLNSGCTDHNTNNISNFLEY